MTYTSTQLDTVLDNLSGPLPSSIFEEYIDSMGGTFEQQSQVVMVHRCSLSTDVDEYIVFPFAGEVKAIYGVLQKTIATADETIVFKNGSDELGTMTIAYSGSAAGDVDTVTLDTDHTTFTAGEFMLMEIGGESANDPQYDIVIVYQRS